MSAVASPRLRCSGCGKTRSRWVVRCPRCHEAASEALPLPLSGRVVAQTVLRSGATVAWLDLDEEGSVLARVRGTLKPGDRARVVHGSDGCLEAWAARDA